MCYAENGTVKFLEALADNVFTHNYSIMEIKKKKLTMGKFWGYPPTPLKNNCTRKYCARNS
jgi:hypothetical protein